MQKRLTGAFYSSNLVVTEKKCMKKMQELISSLSNKSIDFSLTLLTYLFLRVGFPLPRHRKAEPTVSRSDRPYSTRKGQLRPFPTSPLTILKRHNRGSTNLM